MKLCCRKLHWIVFLALFLACGRGEEGEPLLILSRSFDFNESDEGWAHGFADFPVAAEDSSLFELKYAHTIGPEESILTKRSLMLSGNNVNRDLFMYLKTKITHLRPETDYVITFHVELAPSCNPLSSASAGSLYLKAGATGVEPEAIVQEGYYRMNFDKGNQATSGRDAVSLGKIGPGVTNSGYAMLSLSNTLSNSPYVARTNAKGELWLVIGTDSDLDGYNTIYYRRINVVFSAS